MNESQEQLERLVELREHGKLASSDVTLLHQNSDLAHAFVEALAENAEWRELAGAVTDPETFKQAILKKAQEDNASEFTTATINKGRREGLLAPETERAEPSKRSRHQTPKRTTPKKKHSNEGINWKAWSAVAASVLVACLLMYYAGKPRSPQIVARLGKQCRETTITRNGVSQSGNPGTTFLEGDLLQTGANGFATLILLKGSTQIEVGKDTSMMAAPSHADTGGLLFLLQRGTVKAHVSPQAPDHPLRIQTEQSTASVVGTEFSLTAMDKITTLAVTSGSVRLSQNERPLSVDVTAGHCALDAGLPNGPILGQKGTLHISCDNEFQLFFNGIEFNTHSDWYQARTFIVPILANKNVIAVKGVNTGSVGGLLLDLRWGTNGKKTMRSTKAWKVSSGAANNWFKADFDDSSWVPATEYASLGGGRWARPISGFPTNSQAMWIWSNQPEGSLALFRHSFSSDGIKQ